MENNTDIREVHQSGEKQKYPIKTYRIELLVTKPLLFRYFPGFIWRNALVSALKEERCQLWKSERKDPHHCDKCICKNECIYFILNLPYRAQKTNFAQPYMLNADDFPQDVVIREGTRLTLGLRLFGNADNYLLHFLNAIWYIGESSGIGSERGKFRILSYTDENPRVYLYPDSKFFDARLEFQAIHFKKLPKEHRSPDFFKLIMLLRERISELQRLYQLDTPPIADTMENISVNRSHFVPVKLAYPRGKYGNMDYYICNRGYFEIGGDLMPYTDMLNWGSVIGLGQYTTAGLGTYSIYYE